MILELLSHHPMNAKSAPPLLFVHGAWHGAWCWNEYFLPYFAQQGYHAHALSLRGHGDSPKTKRMLLNGIWDYVADVKHIADQLQAEHGIAPVLIGHSMGGYTVQKYLEKHPASGAVLVASIPSIGTMPFTLRFMVRYPHIAIQLPLRLSAYPVVSNLARSHRMFFSDDMPREQVKNYHDRIGSESVRILLDGGLFHIPRKKLIRSKNVPMLVIAAENDRVFPVREEESTAKAYDAPLVIIKHTAHDMMLEKTWQETADHIVAWLEKLP
jgi:pimeloyl-ACP methyl ester carboxylesterase